MTFSTTQVLLGLLATTVSAFPTAMLEEAMKSPEMAARAAQIASTRDKRQVTADPASTLFEPIPIFNAAAQYVDVGPGSGHEWQAPGPNDLRGPCPGLNAFANHGFIPKNGYATIAQFVEATGVWIIKSVVIFAFVMGVVPMILLLERKLLGRFQNRYGPNRVGPYGLLQPLADVMKLMSKEPFYPSTGVPRLMAIAPSSTRVED